MEPSGQLDFDLQALLEQLDQDELSKFKSLVRTLRQERELPQVIQTEWAAIMVFNKMNRTDLSERVRNELREAAMKSLEENKPRSLDIKRTEAPNREDEEEIIRRLEERDPELTKIQIKDITNLGRPRRFLEGQKPGKEDTYRGIIMKKFWKAWNNNGPGAGEHISDVTQRDKMLIPFCDPRTLPGVFPHTLVLHGPAGFGKTTLTRKVILDWTENHLNQTFRYAFYFTCKELNRMGPCTFAELISKDWPEWRNDLPEVLARAYRILVIIDGFEELKVPEGALIRDICGNWEEQKPVPVLLGSLLIGTMLPNATLLVTTRSEALGDLRLLLQQPLFLEIEGFLEQDKKAYFLKHFEDEEEALRAFDLMRSNSALFRMCAAPAVCWVVCTCLKLQMERGQDPAPTCLSATSLFLRFLCGQFMPENKPFSETDTKEFLYCLYESQDEGLVKDAMAPFKEISLHLRNKMDMVHSSFCLKHCQNLQKIWLHVAKGVFLESGPASEPHAQLERSQDDQHIIPFWRDLCSMFGSNMNLKFLKISESFLSTSSVQLLCQEIVSTTCYLQKVVLKDISPADFCQNFCLALRRHKTLTHLTLQGNNQNDTLPSLCEILRHPKCNLQYLRLVSCSATPQQWAGLSSALEANESLTCLILSANKLMDEGVKLLHTTLRHPKSVLQKLSLENCHLTEACCKNLASALIISQRLTHLCLAENTLGDRGVEILCEGLRYPECKLQILVLWHCNITDNGCKHLSKVIEQQSSLTHLDLGLNHVGITGLRSLCEALKEPLCNLRCLWLWGCSITRFSCEDLSAALGSNRSLITLDLGQNSLGFNGVKMLCEALKRQNCPLQTLRLKIERYDAPMQKLLEEMKESNPQLTIEDDRYDPRKKRPSSRYFVL
uniref:NLR family pyrin domain containing 2 n=1 Tax=Propithecus coquereli TaxID=379532 RepID=A0A2K6GCG9_PROCO